MAWTSARKNKRTNERSLQNALLFVRKFAAANCLYGQFSENSANKTFKFCSFWQRKKKSCYCSTDWLFSFSLAGFLFYTRFFSLQLIVQIETNVSISCFPSLSLSLSISVMFIPLVGCIKWNCYTLTHSLTLPENSMTTGHRIKNNTVIKSAGAALLKAEPK